MRNILPKFRRWLKNRFVIFDTFRCSRKGRGTFRDSDGNWRRFELFLLLVIRCKRVFIIFRYFIFRWAPKIIILRLVFKDVIFLYWKYREKENENVRRRRNLWFFLRLFGFLRLFNSILSQRICWISCSKMYKSVSKLLRIYSSQLRIYRGFSHLCTPLIARN